MTVAKPPEPGSMRLAIGKRLRRVRLARLRRENGSTNEGGVPTCRPDRSATSVREPSHRAGHYREVDALTLLSAFQPFGQPRRVARMWQIRPKRGSRVPSAGIDLAILLCRQAKGEVANSEARTV